MYRNYLLKAKTLHHAYSRLDDECPNLVINDDLKTDLESILMTLKTMRSIVGKPNKINELLNKADISYVQSVKLLGFEVHYLGYLFIERPKLTWELSMFAIVFGEDPERQYALKQMGVHCIRVTRISKQLVRFLSEIGRGKYISRNEIPMPYEISLRLTRFWEEYSVAHVDQIHVKPIYTDWTPPNSLPLIKEPDGVEISNEIAKKWLKN